MPFAKPTKTVSNALKWNMAMLALANSCNTISALSEPKLSATTPATAARDHSANVMLNLREITSGRLDHTQLSTISFTVQYLDMSSGIQEKMPINASKEVAETTNQPVAKLTMEKVHLPCTMKIQSNAAPMAE